MDECRYYINNLDIPDGYTIEIKEIRGAKNITEAYNEAMLSSDAKYKIYIHQDLLIVKKSMLFEMLEIFRNEQVGIIGVIGGTLYRDGNIHSFWNQGSALNAVYQGVIRLSFPSTGPYTEVEGIDGMFIATQYDVEWDTRLSGWHFYDVSQCIRFKRQGYHVCVSNIEPAWTLHVSDYCNIDNYDESRKQLCNLYPDCFEYVPTDISVNDIGKEADLKKLLYDEVVKNEIENYGVSKVEYLGIDDFFEIYYEIRFLLLRIEFGRPFSEWKKLIDYIKEKRISIRFLEIALNYSCLNPDKVAQAIEDSMF